MHEESNLPMNKYTNWSKKVSDDVSVVDLKRRGEIMIGTVNIYNQRARETRERPARRLN